MATKIPHFNCMQCFETRALKVVGKCKHAFCEQCLSIVFTNHVGDCESGKFACPVCKKEYPTPHNGVQGLDDYEGDNINCVMNDDQSAPRLKRNASGKRDTDRTDNKFNARCQICQHRGTDVRAKNLCLDCDGMYICEECTERHISERAFTGHEIIPLQSAEKKRVAICIKHDTHLKKFCNTCGHAVCRICISLKHGDHTIENLSDTIKSNVQKAKALLRVKQEDLFRICTQKRDLTVVQGIIADTVREKKALVLKNIQSHAQECIDAITMRKEELEEEVSTEYEDFEMIPEHLLTFSENEEKFSEPVKRAKKLLDEASMMDQDPAYLEEVTTMLGELEALQTPEDTENWEDFRKELRQLYMTTQNFIPEGLPDLGHIEKTSKTNHISKMDCTEIHQDSIPADADDMFIPCVAMLGRGIYAVAQPVQQGQLSKAINIYDLTGTLKTTLTDHGRGVYDMTSTQDNKLAILSNTEQDKYCCVKIFDPEAGYIKTVVETKMTKPKSLGVGLQNKYAIHGANKKGKEQIIIVEKDGKTMEYDLKNCFQANDRITLGGWFIFVKRYSSVDIYQLQNKDISLVRSWSSWIEGKMMDISATPWDDFVFTNMFHGSLELGRFEYDDEEIDAKSWSGGLIDIHGDTIVATRVAIRDNHIVVSNGITITVFELEEKTVE